MVGEAGAPDVPLVAHSPTGSSVAGVSSYCTTAAQPQRTRVCHTPARPRQIGTSMQRTMRAIVKTRPAPGISLEEVPVPALGTGQLLIRMEKVAICGTDVHVYEWNEWAQRTIRVPQILGHEFVGHIVEIGDGVSGFFVGERVSGEGHIVCGVCRSCRAGRRHLCTNTVGVGVNRDGCFTEYLLLPVTNAWHVAGSIPSRIAAIARYVGARNIMVSDINDYRLELAKRMGATRTVNVKRESIGDVMHELGMIGFDVGLEMSGNAEAFETMLESMHNGGLIALLGIAPTAARIDRDQVVLRGLTIKGIYGRKIWETWYKMQTMLQSGLDISPVITRRAAV